MTTPLDSSDLIARGMIFEGAASFPWLSSSFAAVIHTSALVGIVFLALFRIFCAFLYVSSFASASHSSTCCGQHSTALDSKMRASFSSEMSTTAFHSRTLSGTRSSARSRIRFLELSSVSRLAARIQILTDFGSAATPLAKTPLASSPFCSLDASNQTSSDPGHSSHPFSTMARASCNFPATSSSLAAAIQPGACLGLVLMTDLSKSRAFLMSLISASDLSVTD